MLIHPYCPQTSPDFQNLRQGTTPKNQIILHRCQSHQILEIYDKAHAQQIKRMSITHE